MKSLKRARSEEGKAQRIRDIISAAEACLLSRTIDQCSMDEIALLVGISKPALYRYFRVKELIFLELYCQKMIKIADKLQVVFRNPTGKKMVNVFKNEVIFCELSGILSTVLERPLVKSEAVDWKRKVVSIMSPLTHTLSTTMNVKVSECFDFIMRMFSVLIGCWHLCYPSELMKSVYREPDLSFFNMNFYKMLEKQFTIMLLEFK